MSTMMSIITKKRLVGEMKTLLRDKLDYAQAYQDEKDPFLFYFLLVGEKGSDYEGGYYIGKIMLPPSYPGSPPDYMMLTPNGRFTHGQKICITNSGYHSADWTPSWTVKNMLVGFYSIFIVDVDHGISHIKDSPQQRKIYASQSINYNMKYHQEIFKNFNQFIKENGVPYTTEEITKINNEYVLRKKEKKDKKEILAQTIQPTESAQEMQPTQPTQEIHPIQTVLHSSAAQKNVLQSIAIKKDINKPIFKEKKIIGSPVQNPKDKYKNMSRKELLDNIQKMSLDTFDKTPLDIIKNNYRIYPSSL